MQLRPEPCTNAAQGYSLTREEIETRRPALASDLFRMVPGVRLEYGRQGEAPLLRYRGCRPDLVLDGVPLTGAVAVDDIVTMDDVEAVEVHSGTFFPARVGARSCATVMVWTREGSRAEGGRPLTLRGGLAAAAFVALSILLTR